jgi:response regulator RpfG family c-di-GMP phosphodiesterase
VAEPLTDFSTCAGNSRTVQHLRERWDGSGFPDRLAGEAIPLASRLIAVADAFDRLVSDRDSPCRADVACALVTLRSGAGRAWDPQVVEAIVAIASEELAGVAFGPTSGSPTGSRVPEAIG